MFGVGTISIVVWAVDQYLVTRFKTWKRQGLIYNRLLIRSLPQVTAGQVICKLQVFNSLFRIVELSFAVRRSTELRK